MRFVEQAAIRPSRCAVFPHIPGNHRDGFIDSGSELLSSAHDNHVYVSVVAVREMARMIGWLDPDAKRDLENRVAVLERENHRLEDEVIQLNREFEAIDLLESAGYTARKKPGRPAKAPKEA